MINNGVLVRRFGCLKIWFGPRSAGTVLFLYHIQGQMWRGSPYLFSPHLASLLSLAQSSWCQEWHLFCSPKEINVQARWVAFFAHSFLRPCSFGGEYTGLHFFTQCIKGGVTLSVKTMPTQKAFGKTCQSLYFLVLLGPQSTSGHFLPLFPGLQQHYGPAVPDPQFLVTVKTHQLNRLCCFFF